MHSMHSHCCSTVFPILLVPALFLSTFPHHPSLVSCQAAVTHPPSAPIDPQSVHQAEQDIPRAPQQHPPQAEEGGASLAPLRAVKPSVYSQGRELMVITGQAGAGAGSVTSEHSRLECCCNSSGRLLEVSAAAAASACPSCHSGAVRSALVSSAAAPDALS